MAEWDWIGGGGGESGDDDDEWGFIGSGEAPQVDYDAGGTWGSFLGSVLDDIAAYQTTSMAQSSMPQEQLMSMALRGAGKLFGQERYGDQPLDFSISDPFAQSGLAEYAEQTKARRALEREALLGDDPTIASRVGVGAAEMGLEVASDLPEALLAGGAGAAAAKSLPWLGRLAKTRPKLAAGIGTGGLGAVEGAREEGRAAIGLSPEEQALRMAAGGLGGGLLGGGIGAFMAGRQMAKAASDQGAAAEEAILDLLGPKSGFDPDIEASRIYAQNLPGALEQQAAVEMSIARALADEANLPEGTVGRAMTDPELMGRLPKEVQEATRRARNILDEQSERLIQPGGKVYDQIYTRSEEMADIKNRRRQREAERSGHEYSEVSGNEIWEDMRALVDDAIGNDTYDEVLAQLPDGEKRLFNLVALEATIDKNKGVYANRAYEKYMQEDFAQNRFRQIEAIRRGHVPEGMTPEDTDVLLQSYEELVDAVMYDSNGALTIPRDYVTAPGELTEEGRLLVNQRIFKMMDSGLGGGVGFGKKKQIPATEWGELKKRTLTDKRVDKAIRVMYGEDVDPARQILRSIRRIAADQQGYEFKKELRARLRQDPEFSDELVPGVFDYEVTSMRETGLPPVFTTSPAKVAEIEGTADAAAGGAVDAINYFSKAMATVMNPVTHGRNITANPMFLMMNGLNPLRFGNPANWKKSIRMLKMLDEDPGKAILKMDRSDLEEFREGTRLMMERGLIENVDVNDLNRYIEDIRARGALDPDGASVSEMIGGFTEKLTTGVGKLKPGKLYQNEDFFFKNLGYMLEKRRLEDMGVFTPDEVRMLTLASMENMLPTYSRVSKITEKFRKAQWIAPFVNFHSELIRTSKKAVETAWVQMRNPGEYLTQVIGHPGSGAQQAAVRKLGMKRMSGVAATMSAPMVAKETVEKVSELVTGQKPPNAEEEKAARSFLPPWSQNNPLAFFRYDRNTGNFSYVDLGYLFPHSVFANPTQLAEPFLSPQIPISEAFRAYQDLTRVSNLNPDEKANVLLKRGYRAVSPGAVKYLERIVRGVSKMTGSDTMNSFLPGTSRYGKEFDPLIEAVAPLGRPSDTVLAGQNGALTWRGKEFARAYRQSRDLSRAERNSGTMRKLDAAERGRRSHDSAAREMLKVVEDARTLGMPEESIVKWLGKDGARLNKAQIEAFMAGRIPEFTAPEYD